MQFLSLPIHFGLACLMALFANRLGLRRWRKAGEDHWTERARFYWPALVSAKSNLFVIPMVLDQAHRYLSPETFDFWVAADLCASLGAMLGTYPMDHALHPRLSFAHWRHRAFAGWIFLVLPFGGLIAAGTLMPGEFGWETLLVVALYLGLHFALQFGLTLRVLRWMRLLVPADERLQKIVAEQSAKSGIRVRATWVLESEQAQAWAYMTTGELLFTTGIFECCDDEELAAVCAHELAHLSESRWLIVGRLLASLNLMPLIFLTPFIHLFGAGGFLLAFGLFLLINWAAPKLSHQLEKRADQMATAQQLNEGVYARALLNLYEHNLMPAVNPRGPQTHPSLYDRLLAAGLTPDFPRPTAPEKVTPIFHLYSVALGIFFALNILDFS